MRNRLLSFWNAAWFSPASCHQLGILRVALLSYLALHLLPDKILTLYWNNSLPSEFMNPGFGLLASPLPFPFPEQYVEGFHTVMLELGVLAAVGLFTRPALFLFTVGYWYLAAVESAFGWHNHAPSLTVQVLLVLTFAPGADAYSVGGVWRWWKARRKGERSEFWAFIAGPPAAKWGVQLVLLLLVCFYVSAGVSKLRYGGVEWLNGNTLCFYMSGKSRSNQLQQYGSGRDVPDEDKWKDGFGLEFYLYGSGSSPFTKEFAKSSAACTAAATSSVALEVLYFFILIPGWPRTLLLLSGAAFHFTIFLLMGIPFFSWVIIDLAMIDWGWLFRRVRSALTNLSPGE